VGFLVIAQKAGDTIQKSTVLIVDDDQSILESSQAIVESAGYAVQTAETARDAIRKAKSDWFDIALLDIKLPDMEGTELLGRLQEIKPRMIKIMVTGSASLDNAIQCVNLGANAYIVKPFNPADLLQVMEEKLKERRAAERIDEDNVTDFIEERLQKLETLHSLDRNDK
jgi:Response regulator containing CheY-like receiver, AAA-type ATPase, and DNA-binding domains